MKEIYEKPVAEIEEFNKIDVITFSSTDDNEVTWPFG